MTADAALLAEPPVGPSRHLPFSCAKLLRVPDAAEYLGIRESKLHQIRARGDLTPKKLDGKTLYLREDLDEYAETLPDRERA